MITYRGVEADPRGHVLNEMNICHFCGVDGMRAVFRPCVENAPRDIEIKAEPSHA